MYVCMYVCIVCTVRKNVSFQSDGERINHQSLKEDNLFLDFQLNEHKSISTNPNEFMNSNETKKKKMMNNNNSNNADDEGGSYKINDEGVVKKDNMEMELIDRREGETAIGNNRLHVKTSASSETIPAIETHSPGTHICIYIYMCVCVCICWYT